MHVKRILALLVCRDNQRAEAHERRLEIDCAAKGSKRRRKLESLHEYLTTSEDQRRSQDTLIHLAQRAIDDFGVESGPAPRTLILWYQQYAGTGRFDEDYRGKWERMAIMSMLPTLRLDLKAFVAAPKSRPTLELSRRFISNRIRELARAAPELAHQLLKRGVNIEKNFWNFPVQ